jgi:hypothetical protein
MQGTKGPADYSAGPFANQLQTKPSTGPCNPPRRLPATTLAEELIDLLGSTFLHPGH